jgi:hypothetical protein
MMTTITNSVITGNAAGIRVSPSASAAVDVSTINLGTAATGDAAGNNHIFGNTGAAVCLPMNQTGMMSAMGNVFSADASKDCTGTPTQKLSHTPDCKAAVDVANGSLTMIVDNCQFN